MKKQVKGVLLSSLLLVSTSLFAAEGQDASCEAVLKSGTGSSTFRIIPSDRVAADAKVYEEYVKELTEPGGILDKLGIKMTGQVVEFLQPNDLNALTSGTAGGYPVSHYMDGAAVLDSLKPKGGGFALEVVYPGPVYQHGFYRDDNPLEEQISIIDHVVGHNHFAFTSGLTHYRYGQGMVATRRIDQILRDAYEDYNKDEVQRFYLWALTAQRLWDFYAPLLENSSEFEPYHKLPARDALGQPLKNSKKRERVTENVLAVIAANLPSDSPGWKRDLLEQMITAFSFRPALVHTQIMNEGWASIMQEILPKHSKFHHNFNFWVPASRVMQNEGKPNLRDPYSLGVFCWRRIRERIWNEPEVRGKSILEKDRIFIERASEIIATMTDEEFLRYAMDQTFVDRYNLAVVNMLPHEQWDDNLQHPGDPELQAQWMIQSRDAERVVQMVIDRVLKPKYYLNPRVKRASMQRPATGEFELIMDDEVGVHMPLNKGQLGPSLYALANVHERPVSLVASILVKPEFNPDWSWDPKWGPRPPWYRPAEPEPEVVRVRVTVSPNGDLRAYRITDVRKNQEIATLPDHERMLDEVLDQDITDELSAYLAGYIEDLYMEDDAELERVVEGSPTLRRFRSDAIAKMIDEHPYDGMVTQSPNSAGAILEYKSMLDRRLSKALERAAKKKGGIMSGPNGARVKALPSVVSLQFDYNYLEKLKSKLTVNKPVAPRRLNRTLGKTSEELAAKDQGSPFNPDEGGRGGVGEIHGNEGDRFWGPGDPEGQQSGTDPGEDDSDLSWVNLPDGMYEKFLGERVRLPILNHKPGLSRTKAKRQGGSIRKRQGVMIPDEILNNAIKRGVGGMQSEGEDPFADLGDTLTTGFEYLQPKDIVVKHKVPTKKPDIKAVVTFVLDASGSTAHYYEAFKRFVNDVETLIRANYKGFEFKYIVFDTKAVEMKNRDAFFRAKLGGGTYYTEGLKKNLEVLNRYPRHEWDRYSFLLGDMEDFQPDAAMNLIRQSLENSEFFGAVAGLYSEPRLHQSLKSESVGNPAVGYTVLDQDGGYRIDNIREVLKNTEDEAQ